MKFQLGRYGIQITPDCESDEAYIEDTLGLTKNNTAIPLVRIGCLGSFRMAYLSTPSVHDRKKWICETGGGLAERIGAADDILEGKPGAVVDRLINMTRRLCELEDENRILREGNEAGWQDLYTAAIFARDAYASEPADKRPGWWPDLQAALGDLDRRGSQAAGDEGKDTP